jgi:hypothetical protein
MLSSLVLPDAVDIEEVSSLANNADDMEVGFADALAKQKTGNKTIESGQEPVTEMVQSELPTAPHLLSFPSFPSVESLDFASIIDTSPALDESQRQTRYFTQQSQIPEVDFSSPENGGHRRGYMSIQLSELGGTRHGVSVEGRARSGMALPQIPLSPFGPIPRRRRSDAVQTWEDEYPRKRRRGSISGLVNSSTKSTGSKTVSGYLGMSRRGVISRRQHASAVVSPLSRELKPDSGELSLLASRLDPPSHSKGSVIRRVIIKAKSTILMDRKLLSPFVLLPRSRMKWRNSLSSSSPLYPLDESEVFGFWNMIQGNPPPPLSQFTPRGQTMTPQPSSSPTRQPLSNRASSVRYHERTKQLLPASIQSQGTTILPPTHPSESRSITIPMGMTDLAPTPPSKSIPATSVSTPKPSKSGKPAKVYSPSKFRGTFLDELKDSWKTPDLSKDCVISYAEEGSWLDGVDKGGIIRQVKSARMGYFQESEVVFAVRYLVG